MRRYVVLWHEGIALPHFDFLFEWEPGESLTSFRCPAWPPSPGERWEERPDHRRRYLDYEGPVSGDRGVVVRRAAGEIVVVVASADSPSLSLQLDEMLAIVVVHDIARSVWIVTSTSA